jgi:hypothetical protein
MKRHVRNFIPQLKKLQKLSPVELKAHIRNANLQSIKTLVEIVYNGLKGNVPLKKSHIRKLRRHKSKLRRLVSRRTGWKTKRKILEQSGGFFPLLAAPLLSLAATGIGEAIAGAFRR